MQSTKRSALGALVLVFVSCVAIAGEETFSVERRGDGNPVCGLGKEFHSGRRAALRAALGEGLVLLRGLPETRDYRRFHQDKVFWYFTGIESPDATLLIDLEKGEELLFLPGPDARKESWEGELWDSGDDWIAELTGFTEVRPNSELEAVLEARIDDGTDVWISTQPHVALGGCYDRAIPYDRHTAKDPLDGRVSREAALERALEKRFGAEVRDASPVIDDLRRVKTAAEVEAMRRAGRSGALAMVEAMRATAPGVGEWEIEALMTLVQIRFGATGPAYHGIVGSGPNSNVLHYSTSARAMHEGEVLLIDYAPELDHYTSDITRTWPVDGRFSERAAELYDAVLEAQKAGIAAVKPGMTLRDVNKVCNDLLKEKGYGAYLMHGATHYIGMEVHDVGAYQKPIEPGVAFTIEPGLYDREANIGIRIEDVVVVTADGCEVITGDVPKERSEVEALVGSRSVFDWLDAAKD